MVIPSRCTNRSSIESLPCSSIRVRTTARRSPTACAWTAVSSIYYEILEDENLVSVELVGKRGDDEVYRRLARLKR